MTRLSQKPQDLASGRWFTLSLAEQLGNVGSDFERVLRWRQRQKPALAAQALGRTLDQLDWTLADPRHAGPRRREIARLREEVCRELFSETLNVESAQRLQKYFLAFATAAQRDKGR